MSMKTYGSTMQYNSKSLGYIKSSKSLPQALTYALSVNHH